MEKITAAGNTEVPAYLTIQSIGYEIQRQFLDAEKQKEIWVAEKENLQISAPSPTELLGLILMRSERGKEWKASNTEIDDFLREYYPNALDD